MSQNKYAEWLVSLISDAMRSELTGSLTLHFQCGKIKSVDKQETVRPSV